MGSRTAGIDSGLPNNRISAWHTGASGTLIARKLKRKSLLSYSRNFGTYAAPFRQMTGKWYFRGELKWTNQAAKYSVCGKFGADYSRTFGKETGLGIGLRKWF